MEEVYRELAMQVADLFQKRTADCSSIQDVSEKLVTDQLLTPYLNTFRSQSVTKAFHKYKHWHTG